jgi:membrane protease YdiL (CAAX protease family)
MAYDALLAPLVLYSMTFQTAVYMSLPAGVRARLAPYGIGAVGVLIGLAALTTFGSEAIGLGGNGLGGALLLGLGTCALVSTVGLIMLRKDSLRHLLVDSRVAGLSKQGTMFAVLVRIPLVTALVEEVVFRGVLHAALMAAFPPAAAVWIGAALFGIWHLGPAVDQAQENGMNRRGQLLHSVVTVVAMTLAGAILVWLRVETGSIWAPLAVHAAANMAATVLARIASRSRTAEDAQRCQWVDGPLLEEQGQKQPEQRA